MLEKENKASKLIKRQDVIELIENSHYDLANSEDDMWAMVADVEKLPVIETESNGLKSDFKVMDALIDSVTYELTEVRDEINRVRSEMHMLKIQYERLKKEHQQLQENTVPVKHGRWVGNERHTSCSICGQTYCVPDGQEGHLDMTFYKYCPNCGADMRGDNGDNE